MKKTKEKGITLVALVITIIILLILAGITISSLSSSGLINRAIQASEETKISEYTEKIELIKAEVRLNKSNPAETPTLDELKDAFDNKNWVDSTDIIIDNDIEKLKLITKEGYIFYVTVNKTEYKGKGIVVDTSALEREDVLKLEITTTNENGRMVKITDITGVDYYKIQYQIGSEDGEWTEIKSGNEVEVPFGKIIYARLIYGTNYGVTYRMSVAHTNPTLTLSTDDYSNLTRKTDIPLSDLFQVTWGSEGVGKCYYFVKGKLKFNNTDVNYNANVITNLSELELGTYTIGCGVATPTQVANNQYEIGSGHYITVNISKFKNTTVTNSNDESVVAYAIYSEYDLAYFRDLVNISGNYSINGKIMNDIDLTKVCSASVGSWTPIGYVERNGKGVVNGNFDNESLINCYNGIFDSNLKKISNLYINDSSTTKSLGLVGGIKGGEIKNCIIVNTDIIGNECVGAIAGYINDSKISNCKITGSIKGKYATGGAVGWIDDNSIIYKIKNEANITSTGSTHTGGIAGVIRNGSKVQFCYNTGIIKGNDTVGGIVARAYNGITIEYSYNSEVISSNTTGCTVGGIVGYIQVGDDSSYITNCYNLGNITGTKATESNVGGIAGNVIGISKGRIYLNNVYNKGSINNGANIGGIYGYGEYVTTQGELLNYGAVTNYMSYAGAISGNNYNLENDFINRAYGGQCSSSLKTNGNGTNNSYDANLVMPSVYSIVNSPNTGEFIQSTDEEKPKLKDIEY